MTSTIGYVHRLDGADISHHQHDVAPVNFDKLRTATDWCATKATQSTRYVDPTFRRHWTEMQRVGFRHRLAYHWLSSTTDPIEQARHFLATWDRTGGAMLDAEEAGIDVNRCAIWLATVEAAIRRPVSVYSGLYVAGGTIWKSSRIREGAFGPRPMHLAAYVTRDSLLARLGSTGTLHLPIHAWQWSSDGPVPGVTGRCDMNTIVDRDIYDRACAVIIVPLPQPIPDPVFTTAAFAATGDDDMLRILARRSATDPKTPDGPERWVSNGLVRFTGEEHWIDWLTRTHQCVPGQNILAPELLDPAELAGIPLVEQS